MFELRTHPNGFPYVVDTEQINNKFAPPEHDEQVALVNWLRKKGALFHSIPNSGATSKRRISYMVAEGLVAGVPDLYILDDPSGPIAIEMKRSNGKLSDIKPEQRKFLCALARSGWRVVVCYGSRAAVWWLKEIGYERGTSSN